MLTEHRRRSTDCPESGPEFETLIADLSTRFIDLHPDEVSQEIHTALRRVCEFLEIDLAVLWQWSLAVPHIISPTHIYPAPEEPQPPEPMSQEQYPWSRQQMLAGRVITISTLDEIPEEGAIDRETCLLFGIKSVICLPLSVGGEPPLGALGFNSLRAERDWPDALVARLQHVAQIFTNALARRRHELNLLESNYRLSLAADSAEAGLWTLDHTSGAFWATERIRTIFGYTPDEELILDRFMASICPEDRELVQSAIERSVRERQPIDVEYRILRADGHERWISSRGRPRLNSVGEVKSLMGVSIDVTEHKLIEEALRVSQARLAAGADLAGLGYYEVDFVKRMAFADQRFHAICGIPPDRQQGLQPLEFWIAHLHPSDVARVMAQREQLHDGSVDRLSIEYRFLNDDGERRFHHVGGVARRDQTGRAIATFGVLRDITESKQTEETLRDLSRRLIKAHEEERALLARELHDDVTQRLAVLAIDVGRAEIGPQNGPQTKAMRMVREGLVSLSEDIHTLAYQLHPSVLEELGLGEALRTECERFSRRSATALSADLDPVPADVGKDEALCLFRVAQESLNNVIRHASAPHVSVALRQMDGGLLLAVRDDGVGFDPEGNGKSRSLGLASMRERVRLVNGTLDLESAPGLGTAVIAWIPVEGGSR